MGNSMQSPACDPYELPALVSRLRSWARRLWARAVRDCGDVVRAGWIDWQALVPGGTGYRLGGFWETMAICGYY